MSKAIDQQQIAVIYTVPEEKSEKLILKLEI